MARKNSGDVEDDGSFLVGEGILGGRLVSEGIVPAV